MSNFSSACPNCNREILIPEEFIVKQIECPHCRWNFSVSYNNKPTQSNFNALPRNIGGISLTHPPITIVAWLTGVAFLLGGAIGSFYLAMKLNAFDLSQEFNPLVFTPIITGVSVAINLLVAGETVNLLTQIKNKK